jgi:hypothetical protein
MRVSPDWNTFMKLFGTNFKRVPKPNDEPDLFDDLEEEGDLLKSARQLAWTDADDEEAAN